ncbi:hypothetical protein AB4254_07965 [Vibrio breoganii]
MSIKLLSDSRAELLSNISEIKISITELIHISEKTGVEATDQSSTLKKLSKLNHSSNSDLHKALCEATISHSQGLRLITNEVGTATSAHTSPACDHSEQETRLLGLNAIIIIGLILFGFLINIKSLLTSGRHYDHES